MICKNCKRLLPNQINYCTDCGAKVIRNRLTLRNLFDDFNQHFLNYDNTFLKTLIHLFTKPEAVIDSYINGTRKKYVNAIGYFTIALTFAGLQMYIINKFFPDALDFSTYNPNSSELETQTQNKIIEYTREYQSIIMMFYIPIYALISKITFFNIKKYNYTEHLVVYMYTQAQVTIVGFVFTIGALLLGMPFMFIGFLMLPLMVIYIAYCLKRLYNLSIGGIILRTLFFGFISGFFLVVFVAISMGIYLYNGGLETIKEAAKEAQKVNS